LADDAFQNTLVKAYINIDKVKDSECFKKWLFSIGKNESYNLLKKNIRDINVCEASFTNVDDDCGALSQDDFSMPLEDMMIIKDEQDIVANAINDLIPQERDIIILRYYCQLSWKGISRIKNTSKNAAINKHKRIIKKLRRILEAENITGE
jgi:RNA polymerase sigma-70 factor (ECF subfamily)